MYILACRTLSLNIFTLYFVYTRIENTYDKKDKKGRKRRFGALTTYEKFNKTRQKKKTGKTKERIF